ncbi:hypothetical protein ZHAS_00015098 [Anopheles sinensis]|uniref:Uncharacterized protein n=1 Tax=Anopheles sinensis TaxID=74873 RepID=A0A084WAC2_ANOSI|nr:hypothetical protein ZHAS_00015098 [Anopheles sinensis]
MNPNFNDKWRSPGKKPAKGVDASFNYNLHPTGHRRSRYTPCTIINYLGLAASFEALAMEMQRIAVEKEQRENMEHRERVEEALKLLRRDVRHSRTELEVLANASRPRDGIVPADFRFKILDSKEELDKLELRLGKD